MGVENPVLTEGGGDKRRHILNFAKRVHIHEGHWYHSQQGHISV